VVIAPVLLYEPELGPKIFAITSIGPESLNGYAADSFAIKSFLEKQMGVADIVPMEHPGSNLMHIHGIAIMRCQTVQDVKTIAPSDCSLLELLVQAHARNETSSKCVAAYQILRSIKLKKVMIARTQQATISPAAFTLFLSGLALGLCCVDAGGTDRSLNDEINNLSENFGCERICYKWETHPCIAELIVRGRWPWELRHIPPACQSPKGQVQQA